eukprot:3916515-Pyramimonas_sp.AAC.1
MARIPLSERCIRWFPEVASSALNVPSTKSGEKECKKFGVFSITSHQRCTRLASNRCTLAVACLSAGKGFGTSYNRTWCNAQHRLAGPMHPGAVPRHPSTELGCTQLARGRRLIVAWDLDNVHLRGPSERAESLLQCLWQVAAALKPQDPLAEVEIHAFANQDTLGQAWLSKH